MTTQSKKITGSCFCGDVKFEYEPEYLAYRYCFCSRCRKVRGTAHAANIFVPDRGFTRELDERIFARDVPLSRRVKVRKLSWWQKIKGFTLHMIRGVL